MAFVCEMASIASRRPSVPATNGDPWLSHPAKAFTSLALGSNMSGTLLTSWRSPGGRLDTSSRTTACASACHMSGPTRGPSIGRGEGAGAGCGINGGNWGNWAKTPCVGLRRGGDGRGDEYEGEKAGRKNPHGAVMSHFPRHRAPSGRRPDATPRPRHGGSVRTKRPGPRALRGHLAGPARTLEHRRNARQG